MSDELKEGYEVVWCVLDYYDGERRGIADFEGVPYLFECPYDEENANGYAEFFLLTPLVRETFDLAMEDWEIFVRYYAAFEAGNARADSHPALPQDRERHEELQQTLRRMLVSDVDTAIRAKGDFRILGAPGRALKASKALQVKWTKL